MNKQIHPDPLAFLYASREPLFENYAPEGEFSHGKPVVVARLRAVHAAAYSCVMSETRVPASFVDAVVYKRNAPMMRISTGSGAEAAQLAYKLCAAFANGSVQLSPSVKYRHTVGIGQGRARVILCFADLNLCVDVVNGLKSEMLALRWEHQAQFA